MPEITGTFEIKFEKTPLCDDQVLGFKHLQMSKTFNGALDATSTVWMMNAFGQSEGSAGYVALEKVTGRVDGKKGSFIAQHYGVSNRGTKDLIISIIPDTGTDELESLTGKMDIQIRDGQHFYTFEYHLKEEHG